MQSDERFRIETRNENRRRLREAGNAERGAGRLRLNGSFANGWMIGERIAVRGDGALPALGEHICGLRRGGAAHSRLPRIARAEKKDREPPKQRSAIPGERA